MHTTEFSMQAIAIVAAMQGKGTAFQLIQDAAMGGREELTTRCEEVRQILCDSAGMPRTTGYATLQRSQVKGASTLYSYFTGFLKFIDAPAGVKFYVGKTERATGKRTVEQVTFGIDTITASVMTSNQKALRDEYLALKSGETLPQEPAKKGPTPADLIATLESLHKAGALTAAHYSALAAIVPPAPVKATTPALAQA